MEGPITAPLTLDSDVHILSTVPFQILWNTRSVSAGFVEPFASAAGSERMNDEHRT
jgi:hypothetical protein